MLWSTIHIVVLTVTFIIMANRARSTEARRLTYVPLAMALVEVMVAGLLTVQLHPILSLILAACRLTVIGCCFGVLRRDALAAKARARRRARARRVAAAQPVAASPCLVPFPSRCA